jgi:diguanylate cyclase (GGDEF)-like protein
MMESEWKNRLRAIALRAIALFLVIAAVSVPVVEYVSRNQIADRLDTISSSAYRVLDLQHEIIRSQLGTVSSDLLFLANQNELHAYLEEGNRVYLKTIAREYLELARQKTIYNQIRFLDDYGMETVRIDFNDGRPIIIPDQLLQPKGGRYYFPQTTALNNGEIFVSPFDLNMEQGVVEDPRRPVLRFATPIRDLAGENRGIVILNYLGESLFQALGQAVEGTEQRTFLANWESYWLWGPDPSVEWGFMYYGTGVHTVDTSFPGAWEQMASAHEGQFRTADGLFTFVTIHPIEEVTQSTLNDVRDLEHKNLEGVWKLISFVPDSVLSAVETPIRRLWGIAHGLLMVLAAGVSWFYARFRVLREAHRGRIEFLAKYDSLTGACNRHYFEQSIASEEARARRYKHSISFLMIDITRFKQVNDTYGHKVGDVVLEEVSALLKGSVRETDVVVRYGGDEFLIMFPETPGEADAARDRILQALEKLNADKSRFGFPVILALGSAQWKPASGETIEDALSHADEQMYAHKQSQHDSLGA